MKVKATSREDTAEVVKRMDGFLDEIESFLENSSNPKTHPYVLNIQLVNLIREPPPPPSDGTYLLK